MVWPVEADAASSLTWVKREAGMSLYAFAHELAIGSLDIVSASNVG